MFFVIKFIACNLAGAIVVYFFLYESSNLPLESVDDVCKISLLPFFDDDIDGKTYIYIHRCTTILTANRGLPDHGHRLDTAHAVILCYKGKLLKQMKQRKQHSTAVLLRMRNENSEARGWWWCQPWESPLSLVLLVIGMQVFLEYGMGTSGVEIIGAGVDL